MDRSLFFFVLLFPCSTLHGRIATYRVRLRFFVISGSPRPRKCTVAVVVLELSLHGRSTVAGRQTNREGRLLLEIETVEMGPVDVLSGRGFVMPDHQEKMRNVGRPLETGPHTRKFEIAGRIYTSLLNGRCQGGAPRRACQ